jgi:hypothetical protein
MKTLLLAATLTLMAITETQADTTGNQYLSYSQYERFAYINGMTDGLIMMNVKCGNNQNQTYGQIIRVVEKFLINHPEKTNLQMSLLYGQAVIDAWNCSGEKETSKTEVKW